MLQYSYFLYSLLFVVILAVILFARRDLVWDAIPAFIFGAIAGPVSELLYFSDYWHPESVLRIGDVLIEDVLFGIAIFGLALVLYPAIFQKKLGPIHSGSDRHAPSVLYCSLVFVWLYSSALCTLTRFSQPP